MSPSTNPLVDRYLKQLASALEEMPIPAAERAEIIREIESHLAEALAAGAKVHEQLETLGSADAMLLRLLDGDWPAARAADIAARYALLGEVGEGPL